MAYSIKKHDSAVYVIYTLDIPGANVQKIESILNITDEVIRFLIVRLDLKVMAKADAARKLKAEQAAKRAEREDDKDEDEEE
jgi:ribosomal protein S6